MSQPDQDFVFAPGASLINLGTSWWIKDYFLRVRHVARRYLHGREVTEGLLNHIEVAIRAFDPCLSCATHALGKMPLAVELVDPEGNVVHSLSRS